MSDLHAIKRRIAGIKSTKKITDAMKMVSTVKLWKLEDRLKKVRTYHSEFENIFNLVSVNEFLTDEEEEAPDCYVILGSDRGLCGAYNQNIIKLVQSVPQETLKKSVFIGLGKLIIKPLSDFVNFERAFPDVWDEMDERFMDSLAAYISENLISGKFGKLYFVYNTFKTAVTQIPLIKQVYPPEEPSSAELYEFQPAKHNLFKELMPKFIASSVKTYLLEAETSEYAARMTSMGNASRNANELLSELQISYNKARQSKITLELMEIISGSEAQK